MTPLFLWGTLRHPPLLAAVAGDLGAATTLAATLPGFAVRRAEGGVLPVLVPEAGGLVEGLLLDGLPDEARARLDDWELPWDWALGPVEPMVAGEPRPALAYLAPADLAPSGDPWSLDEWVAEAGAVVTTIAQEIDATAPRPTGADLRRQWPMIAHRASAAGRAAAATAPVSRRHRAVPGDARWTRARPLAGTFFRLDGVTVDHRRFDGGRNEGLSREVMVGADAALVLPYDPARGRVLLVEQMRTGPLRRGDPQPWTLEPVAGLVDAGETPEEAARREAVEEAGLTLSDLMPMFQGYPSPGNATDHFWCFLGLCDLPDDHATSGGLEEEHEDLRLHVLPFEEAMGLVDSGEANAVPLVAMLLWLDRWRRRGLLDAAPGGG